MWRRPLNRAILASPNSQKGREGMSDGTDTQVETWMINKWKAKIVKKELYKGKDIP